MTDDVRHLPPFGACMTAPMKGSALAKLFGYGGKNAVRDLRKHVRGVEPFGRMFRAPLNEMPHWWLVDEGLFPPQTPDPSPSRGAASNAAPASAHGR